MCGCGRGTQGSGLRLPLADGIARVRSDFGWKWDVVGAML